jgi:uncharacterized protein
VEQKRPRWSIPHGVGLVAVAIALVIALPLSASIAINGVKDIKQARNTVVVTGSARYPITANLASWNLQTSEQAQTPAAAIKALRGDVGRIDAFLAQGGLPADSITKPPIKVSETSVSVPTGLAKPRFRRVPAWQVKQTFAIQTSDIDTLEHVSSQVGDLLAAGTPVAVSPIAYLSTNLIAAKFAALRRAVADARRRATTIAQGLGADLGPVQKTTLGVYQVTPRNSTAVSGLGIYDTSSRLKDVESVVSVTFLISH